MYCCFFIVKAVDLVFPSLLELDRGSKATFHCKSQNISYWFFEKDESKPKSSIISYNDKLHIPSVTYQNDGHYFCLGTLSSQSKLYFLNKATLRVYGKSK